MFGVSVVDDGLGALSLHHGQWAVDGPGYVGDADLIGSPAQPVAARGAPLADDDPGLAKLQQNALQIPRGDLLGRGQLVATDQIPWCRREFDERSQRVVDTGCDLHDSIMTALPDLRVRLTDH